MSSELGDKAADVAEGAVSHGEVQTVDASSGEQAAKPSDEPQSITLEQLVQAANRGDAEALHNMRRVLDERPEIWRKVGNLAAHAENTWTRLVADGNALALESIRREADRLRGELLGPAPSPIERLLVDQIVSCWLQVKHSEITAGSAREVSVAQGRFKDQRMERAQRRFLTAMKTLAQIRRLPLSALMPAMNASSRTPAADEVIEPPVMRTDSCSTELEPTSASETTAFRIFPEKEAG